MAGSHTAAAALQGSRSAHTVPPASTKCTLMKCLLLNAAQVLSHHAVPAAGRLSCPGRNLSSCQVSLGKAENKGVPSTSTGVGAPSAVWCLLSARWHPVLSKGRRAPLWEPFAALLGTARGGDTASILTLCLLTQSPSMAAAPGPVDTTG